MKMALIGINGSYSHTNLAIRCLRHSLEKESMTADLFEFHLKDRTSYILHTLFMADCDVYAFSTYIWNIELVKEIACDLHKLKKDAKIVFGGPEASFETDRFTALNYVDAVLVGEGEESIKKLYRMVENGEEIPKILYGTPSKDVMGNEGILYREGEQESAKLYYYESSRGCPFHCAYCLSSVSDGLRMKSVEQVLKDMREFEKFAGKCKIVKFVDRTFNADIKRANAIWEALLSDEFHLSYHFEICATLLNEDSFRILQKAKPGKFQFEVGLQSTNEKTLAVVSRHIDSSLVIRNTERIKNFANSDIYLDLIAGLPFEDLSSFRKSFDDAYFASTRLQVGFLKLLPGTALRDNCLEYGYVFQEKAPYEVLESRWMSYDDMMRVHALHDLCERYVESEHFENTLRILEKEWKSPFDFFQNLAEFLKKESKKPLQKYSQIEVYALFYRYIEQEMPSLKENIKESLIKDYIKSEKKNPPLYIFAEK